jgi:hypothetical protein
LPRGGNRERSRIACGPPSRRFAASIEHGKARNANALNVVDARTSFVPAGREEHEARHRSRGARHPEEGSRSNPAEKYATRMTTNGMGLRGSPPMARRRRRRTDHWLPDRKWAVQRRLNIVNVGPFEPGIQAVYDAVLWRRKGALREGRSPLRAGETKECDLDGAERGGRETDEDDATRMDAERSR